MAFTLQLTKVDLIKRMFSYNDFKCKRPNPTKSKHN